MVRLGFEYQIGFDGSQDYAKARECFEKAAAKNNREAMFSVALLYEYGNGVPKDYAQAKDWYEKAAAKGSAAAMSQIGDLYANGRGVLKDYNRAREWYEKAAAKGDAGAMSRIASLYSKGQSVLQDYDKAGEWYERAAANGDGDGQFWVGSKYASGQGVQRDYAKAREWFEKAAANYNSDAMFNLGYFCENGLDGPVDYVKAKEWYENAAIRGNVGAMLNVANMYSKGAQGVPQDYISARRWFESAAERGNAIAMFNLGYLYENGLGVPLDNFTAWRAWNWYEKAAELGDINAMVRAGVLCSNGAEGVPQYYGKAKGWFEKAAAAGSRIAMYNLGALYAKGQGVPQNYIAAYKWFNLAAAKGDQSAQKSREIIMNLMTPEQIAEAQKQSAEWRPRAPNEEAAATPRSQKKEPERGAASGTAFFVSKEGEALTNAHVVESCQRISVAGRDALLVASDRKNDLALLATGITPPHWASWRSSVRLGEDIVAYGFPLTGVLASSGNVVTGNVTALAGMGDDSRYLQVSAPLQPGNSGGPLLDRHGNVVGVVVAKLDALKIASATGDIPQNVNFAIKASVAQAFLDAHGVQKGLFDDIVPRATSIARMQNIGIGQRRKSF